MLCTVMIASAIVFCVPERGVEAERTIFDIEKELKECQSMLAKVRAELSTIKDDIAKLENQSGQTAQLLEAYCSEIEALEAEIGLNEVIKESYDMKRADAAAKISAVREDYDYQKDMYAELMQFIYEHGEMSMFELLFTSDSVADYLTRRDDFNDIMAAANDMLNNVRASMYELEILQSELEETQKYYENYIADMQMSEIEYKAKVSQYETIALNLGINADELRERYADKNAVISELTAKINKLKKEREALYDVGSGFSWPLSSDVSYRVTSYFGYRKDPFGKKPGLVFHQGLDIACAKNSHIISAKAGTVTKVVNAPNSKTGHGTYVMVYHGNGISTLYGHMTSIASGIEVGVTVKKGQLLGYVGTTGASTGYHLHFGVMNTNYKNPTGQQYDDPDKFLPNGFYTKKNAYK